MTAAAVAWEPLCLEPEELVGWRTGEVSACRDCTAAFAAEMGAIGRCNGIPGEVLVGVIEEEESMEQPTPIGRKVATTLALPCGTCAHEDVCRIRPALLELTHLAVGLPVLDAAIGVDLAATVSCSAYLKARIRKADAGELEAKPRRSMSPEARAKISAAALARRARERAEREAVTA